MTVQAASLMAAASLWLEREPDRVAVSSLDRRGHETSSLTHAEWHLWSAELAEQLASLLPPGSRVLLPPMSGLRFHVAFLACLRAGIVAVPLPPLRTAAIRAERARERLATIAASARPAAAIVAAEDRDEFAPLLPELLWIGLPATPAGHGGTLVSTAPAELALLQYTSGSTSRPRGVMLTHANVLANQRLAAERMALRPDQTMVSWLPLYHDMGLAACLLQPLLRGMHGVAMEPEAFLARPETWLQVVSCHERVVSGAPDFAYALCAERVAEADIDGVRLDDWEVAFSGAEPIRPATLAAFAGRFAARGFRRSAFYPIYGLAESTAFVTGGRPGAEPTRRSFARDPLRRGQAIAVSAGTPGAIILVGCGRPGAGAEIVVADPAGRPLPEGQLGEIRVFSASNGRGYFGDEHATRATFGSGKTLRTGDLGFLLDGELYVVGRLKDVIVVRGVNHHAEDIERVTQAATPMLRRAVAAAFGVDDDHGTRLVVACEVGDTSADARRNAAGAVRRAIAAEFGVAAEVRFAARGALPRTTSGKPRRRLCAERYAAGRLVLLEAA
jgi:acyl-CoA synthetase (AMP-forming)/AMP-acid ligase II